MKLIMYGKGICDIFIDGIRCNAPIQVISYTRQSHTTIKVMDGSTDIEFTQTPAGFYPFKLEENFKIGALLLFGNINVEVFTPLFPFLDEAEFVINTNDNVILTFLDHYSRKKLCFKQLSIVAKGNSEITTNIQFYSPSNNQNDKVIQIFDNAKVIGLTNYDSINKSCLA